MGPLTKLQKLLWKNNNIHKEGVNRDDWTIDNIQSILSIDKKKALVEKLNKGIELQLLALERYIDSKSNEYGVRWYIENVQLYIDSAKEEYWEFNSEEFDNQLRDLVIPLCRKWVESLLDNLKAHIKTSLEQDDIRFEHNDWYYIEKVERSIEYWKKMLESVSDHSEAKSFWEYLDESEKQFERTEKKDKKWFEEVMSGIQDFVWKKQ